MENGTTVPSLDDIIALGEEKKYGHGMVNTIIRSSNAIVSILSSCAVIWMVLQTKAKLTTIHHRILLGMSIADILYSLSMANFNSTAPRDDDYYVWNARGNQATCSAQGFILFLGSVSALTYSCSLNLYYLAVVKYQLSNGYIRRNIEPFLHAIPIVYALVLSITFLAKKNLNGGGGSCYVAVYEPPHCTGYEDGQIPEGFEIPCGRGRDGAVLFFYAMSFMTFFMVPIVIGISLGIIHRAVLQQEKLIAKYVATSVAASSATDAGDTSKSRSSRRSSIVTTARKTLLRTPSALGQPESKSRTVMYKALAYSIAYFSAWSFIVIGVCYDIAGLEWPHFIWYANSFFNPLQGFFNFMIFMHPKVRRKTEAQSQAFAF